MYDNHCYNREYLSKKMDFKSTIADYLLNLKAEDKAIIFKELVYQYKDYLSNTKYNLYRKEIDRQYLQACKIHFSKHISKTFDKSDPEIIFEVIEELGTQFFLPDSIT